MKRPEGVHLSSYHGHGRFNTAATSEDVNQRTCLLQHALLAYSIKQMADRPYAPPSQLVPCRVRYYIWGLHVSQLALVLKLSPAHLLFVLDPNIQPGRLAWICLLSYDKTTNCCHSTPNISTSFQISETNNVPNSLAMHQDGSEDTQTTLRVLGLWLEIAGQCTSYKHSFRSRMRDVKSDNFLLLVSYTTSLLPLKR